MQVTETKAEGLKREYAMTVTAAELEAKVTAKLMDAQPTAQMKGFRKGKVPLPMLKKLYGQSVLGEAVQETVDGAVREHLEGSGDRPARQPEVKIVNEKFEEGDDLSVEFGYERLPDVPDPEFAKIELERLVIPVEDSAVDEALSNLAENAQSFDDRRKGSKAKDGDQVVMDFVGSIGGEAFDGGAGEDFPLVLGSGQFIPGFEEQLVGVKAEEEVKVTVNFPDDYGAPNLAGKEAVFDCTIKNVKEPKPAEIDDELGVKFGAENLEDLKSKISERLAEEYKSASRSHIKRLLLDALDTAVAFDLPESLVTEEANQIAHQLWHEENPEVEGHDHPEIEPTEEHNALAQRRVRLGLLLAEIGKKAEVTVEEGEVMNALAQQARQYPGQEKEFFDFARQNPQVLQQVRAPLFEDKVVDYVLELVKVTEKSSTKEELEAAIEALDAE